VRDFLAAKLNVENFNVGVNDGKLAGQTVPHAHIHIIPRREGDVPDPRGGVRWVIPRKAAYWTQR
jgi:diadenosine tetraphosphate (Ap4A) HIT family hydrolase